MKRRNTVNVLTLWLVVLPGALPAQAGIVNAIEYAGDHMFLTANPAEIAALDSGATPGWKRTGVELWVHDSPADDLVPVCRFYSTAFAPRSSHFYTADAAECAAVKANSDWIDEGIAFYARLPVADWSENNSWCTIGSAPVYRWYNLGQGSAPSHRFTPYYVGVSEIMQASGWSLEGPGGAGVAFCMHNAAPFAYDLLKPQSTLAELLAGSVWQIERAATVTGASTYRFELGFGSVEDASGSVPIVAGVGRPGSFVNATWDVGRGDFAINEYDGEEYWFVGWRFMFTSRDSIVGCAMTVTWGEVAWEVFGGYYAAPCVPFTGHRR